MNDQEQFKKESQDRIKKYPKNSKLMKAKNLFMKESIRSKYSYNFDWLGLPIIQYPQDIMAIQEIIWEVKPDLIIETGIARGGSLIFYASMLELVGGKGFVVGIDIDLKKLNQKAIENHTLFRRIKIINGSSVDREVFAKVSSLTKKKKKIIVILDSNHTSEHVFKELNLYSSLVTKDSFLIVCDTIIADLPNKFFIDRPWNNRNNPRIAVQKFLKNHPNFEINQEIENKLLITVAPGGYLKRIK